MKLTKYNKIIAANWKMNGSKFLVEDLKNYIKSKIDFLNSNNMIIIFPPFPYINLLIDLSNITDFFH